MVRVLVLVSSSVRQFRSKCRGTKANEWIDCWWKNMEDDENLDPHIYTVGFMEIKKNGGKNDILYSADANGNKEKLTEEWVSEGSDFFIAEKGEFLIDLLQDIQNDTIVWIRGDRENGLTEKTLQDNIISILSALSHHRICKAYHGKKPEGCGWLTYSSTGNYWPEILHLRYGGLDRNECIRTRQEAFDNMWKALGCGKPCRNPGARTSEEEVEALLKVWRGEAKDQLISILKHRIAHLWLPLDIDLMGIEEVGKQEAGDRKQKYLMEVLQSAGEQFYQQKLGKLQYMVAGEHVHFQEVDCYPVEPRDKENLLAESKSIYDLILESGKKEEIIESEEWKTLKLLCGLETKDEVNELNPPASGKVYKPDEHSPILGFICLLGSKVLKKESINTIDVDEVLSYFSNLSDGEGWTVPDANPGSIKSFHDWFCALYNALGEIRAKLLSG